MASGLISRFARVGSPNATCRADAPVQDASFIAARRSRPGNPWSSASPSATWPPFRTESAPVAGRHVDLDGEADVGVPLPRLALPGRRSGLAVRMRGLVPASCLQRAEGRNVPHAFPDLDAGDGGNAVEGRLPLEFREAGLSQILTRRKRSRTALSSRLRVPRCIRGGHSVISGMSRWRAVSALNCSKSVTLLAAFPQQSVRSYRAASSSCRCASSVLPSQSQLSRVRGRTRWTTCLWVLAMAILIAPASNVRGRLRRPPCPHSMNEREQRGNTKRHVTFGCNCDWEPVALVSGNFRRRCA